MPPTESGWDRATAGAPSRTDPAVEVDRLADRPFDAASGARAALLAYALLLATCFSWAGNSIAGRMAAGEVSPLLLVTLRWGLAIALVLPFAWRHLRDDRAMIAAHWLQFAGLGILGFTIFNTLLYTALSVTTAVNVVLIQAAMPALIFAINFALYRTRVVALQMVGFAISIVGVGIVVLGGGGGLGAVGLGEAIMVLGALVYACYTVAVAAKPKVHWLSSITVMGAFALLASLPLAGWEVASGRAIWPSDAFDWSVVLYTALFPSLIAQVCFMRGVDLIGSNRAGLFVNLVPVMGTLMAVVILGEAFGVHHALALALAMGGVALAEWGARRRGGR